MASYTEIQKILRDMRSAIDNDQFQPIRHRKNMETLARLGITWADAREEIYALTEKDYFRGPVVDRDDPASDLFWVFKRRIEGETIYIKFKIMYQEDGRVKTVSFHIDEF